MTRQRKHETGLPKRVYLSHGAYYFVTDNIWRRIGSTLDDVDRFIKSPPKEPLSPGEEVILRFTIKLLARTKQNCKKRRAMEFTLTGADIPTLLRRSNYRCAVTGIAFSLDYVGKGRPWAPSIDRIDNAKGYTLANCRIVCAAANFAMNQWGEAILDELFEHRRRWNIRQRPILGDLPK